MLSRRTMLVIYDVLHYYCLNGIRLRRDDVVEYLHRATTNKTTTHDSRLRAFERFKRHLRVLAIPHRVELERDDGHGSWLTIPNPDRALAHVSRLLASTHPTARLVHVA